MKPVQQYSGSLRRVMKRQQLHAIKAVRCYSEETKPRTGFSKYAF